MQYMHSYAVCMTVATPQLWQVQLALACLVQGAWLLMIICFADR
jgi:hypothetical protein